MKYISESEFTELLELDFLDVLYISYHYTIGVTYFITMSFMELVKSRICG